MTKTLTIAAIILAFAPIAHAQVSDGRVISFSVTSQGEQFGLGGRAALSAGRINETLVVQVVQSKPLAKLDGLTFVVTVHTKGGSYDIGAVTMHDGLGGTRIQSLDGTSPAFPLAGLVRISVRWNCQELLTARL